MIACCRVDRKASVLGLDILLNAFSCRAPVTPCEATHVSLFPFVIISAFAQTKKIHVLCEQEG